MTARAFPLRAALCVALCAMPAAVAGQRPARPALAIPAPALRFHAALAASDQRTAAALLAADAQILDTRRSRFDPATLVQILAGLRGCRRLTASAYPPRHYPGYVQVLARWSCGARGAIETELVVHANRISFFQLGPPVPVALRRTAPPPGPARRP